MAHLNNDDNFFNSINKTKSSLKQLNPIIFQSLHFLETKDSDFLKQCFFEGYDKETLAKIHNLKSEGKVEEKTKRLVEKLTEHIKTKYELNIPVKKMHLMLYYYGAELRSNRKKGFKSIFDPLDSQASVQKSDELEFKIDPEYRNQLTGTNEDNDLMIVLVALLSVMYLKGAKVRSTATQRKRSRNKEQDMDEDKLLNYLTHIVLKTLNKDDDHAPVNISLPEGYQCSLQYKEEDKAIEFYDIQDQDGGTDIHLSILFKKEESTEKQYKMDDGKIQIPKQKFIEYIKEGCNLQFLFS